MMIDNYLSRELPDGSSDISSIQAKNNPLSSTLKHLDKLTINFKTLINDEDGQCLFEEFTKLNKIYDYLLFWFAIEGFKRRFNELDKIKDDKNFRNEITIMAKAIYNNFIKNNAKCKVYQWFSKSTRESIYNKIADNKFDSNIFNDVKNEFELKIQNEIFPKFLKSEIYLNYVEDLKLNYHRSKILKINFNKNTKSITNHALSTHESGFSSDLGYDNIIINQNDNTINLNENLMTNKLVITNTTKSNSVNIKLNDNNQKNQICKKQQQQLNNIEIQESNVTVKSIDLNSCLPAIPDDNLQLVDHFRKKLEEVYQDAVKKQFDNIIKKFDDEKDKIKLKSLINNKEKAQPDSQLILDQHCKMVFDSNLHSNGINTPHDDQPIKSSKTKKISKMNQQDNRLIRTSTSKYESNSYYLNNNGCDYGYGILNDNIITYNSNNLLSSNKSKSIITIIYNYSTDNFSYTIKYEKKYITLKEFKRIILDKKIDYNNEKFRYFFKKKAYQLDNNIQILYEELTDDNELVPLYDDKKIISKIEIVSR